MGECKDRLVTICILVYRNYQYIYTALESVFLQDYRNIELIISDDGSDNFPLEAVKSFIDEYAGDNIKNVIINIEKENVGTVKHLNKLIEISNGDYLVALAGDDSFYDSKTISRYIDNFINYPGYSIQMAQTAMYDITLKNLDYYYCQPDIIKLLHDNEFDKLLERIIEFPYFPTTSTCYTKELFDKIGMFDENYKLIEDWPYHIKLLKNRVPILYSNFIAIKHRDGGISHSENSILSKSKKQYYNDMLKIYTTECLPYIDKHPYNKELAEHVRMNMQWTEYLLKEKFFEKLTFACSHPFNTLKSFLKRTHESFIYYGNTILLVSGLLYFLFPLLNGYFVKDILKLFRHQVYGLSLILLIFGVILLGLGKIGRKLTIWEYFPGFKGFN